MDQAKNFAKGTLAAGIDDNDTSVALNTGQGARFPAVEFNAVIWNSTDHPDPADDPNVEIVRVTARSTDTLTITRAQEGTAASEHNTLGKTYLIIAPLTAKVINDLAPTAFLTDSGTVFTINPNDAAGAEFDRNASRTKLGDYDALGEGTMVDINDPAAQVTITKQVIMPNLPTSNPAIAGALWSDGGTVKVSAG